MDGSFEEKLLSDDVEQLNDLKRWLFEENIRLEIRKKELNELHEKFLNEKVAFVEEMKAINLRNVSERKRLKDEEMFFDKKMQILKDGFADLDADRKRLAKERLAFETEKQVTRTIKHEEAYTDLAGTLFAGVNNSLALKKRYRDLLKIFHPDNLCGDSDMVMIINKEYDRLKSDFDYYKSAK
ncbi:MAG: hypothetical protein IK018_12440 [Lachnospiraceae bacterium]|nr:hypothetical protein [Lachnospiraceae bacterium]